MLSKVFTVSPLVLPEELGIARRPPRRNWRHDADYQTKFDFHTLAYDVFQLDARHVAVSGPPARNLAPLLSPLHVQIDGRRPFPWRHKRLDRTCRVIYPAEDAQTFATRVGGTSISAPVAASGLAHFAGKRVLMAISKNNNLQWIGDWAQFHAANHGVNAVLVYDNGSTSYRTSQLVDTLAAVPGIETAAVVEWPFKFGPRGPRGRKFDSNYCQRSMFEHARFRFLAQAAGVLNVDIDELIVTSPGRTVFEVLAQSRTGDLQIGGRWVSPDGRLGAGPSRHAQFRLVEGMLMTQPPKWAVDPLRLSASRQWTTHNVGGHDRIPDRDVQFFHFKAISTNWKPTQRHLTDAGVTLYHDPWLDAALDRAFGRMDRN